MENTLVYVLMWSSLTVSSTLPPPPGTDPIEHLTNIVNNLTTEIHNLKLKVTELERTGTNTDDVAFFARLTHDVHLGDNQPIAFNDAVTNTGGAYDSNTGEFITPIMGTYQFIVVTMGYSGEIVKLSLVKNGTPIADLYDALDFGNMGTQSVILQLNVGDKIWVKNADAVGLKIFGGALCTTFSGFKLH